jgi:hypothetical protein
MLVAVVPRLLRVRVVCDKWILTELFPLGARVREQEFALFKVESLLLIPARVTGARDRSRIDRNVKRRMQHYAKSRINSRQQWVSTL